MLSPAAIDREVQAPMGRPCEACGTPVESLDKFCPACGTTNPKYKPPDGIGNAGIGNAPADATAKRVEAPIAAEIVESQAPAPLSPLQKFFH